MESESVKKEKNRGQEDEVKQAGEQLGSPACYFVPSAHDLISKMRSPMSLHTELLSIIIRQKAKYLNIAY